MNESENNAEKKIARWRFWFAVVFSLLLVVTFIYYLPLRFVYNVTLEEHTEAVGHTEDTGHSVGAGTYHEESDVKEGLAVNLNISPVPEKIGVFEKMDFFVNEKPGNIPVPFSGLEIQHAKLMHVIGIRNDMNEFFHIHPEPTDAPGIFSVEYMFARPGTYKIWSEITQNDVDHIFGHPEINVAGEGGAYNKQVSFGRNAIIDAYQVSLQADEPFVKNNDHRLSFDIHTVTGDEVEVEPYLDANMHLTIIKDDWTQFIHTHPEGHEHAMNSGNGLSLAQEAQAHGEGEEIPGVVHNEAGHVDEVIEFHVVLPEPGLYRAFAQFRPRGINLPPEEALTVSFWLNVQDKAPAVVPVKFIVILISSVLIIVLSVAVKKYISVAPIEKKVQ